MVTGLKKKLESVQILVEFSNSGYKCQCFFLQLSIFFSQSESDLEAYAIGVSLPSGKRCDSTLPIPHDEASLLTTMGSSA